MNYEQMSHDELVEHCESYSQAIHKLASECFFWRSAYGSFTEAKKRFKYQLNKKEEAND